MGFARGTARAFPPRGSFQCVCVWCDIDEVAMDFVCGYGFLFSLSLYLRGQMRRRHTLVFSSGASVMMHRWSWLCVLIQQPVDEESGGCTHRELPPPLHKYLWGSQRGQGRGDDGFALCFAPHPPPSHSYSPRSQGENEIKVTVPLSWKGNARGMLSAVCFFLMERAFCTCELFTHTRCGRGGW